MLLNKPEETRTEKKNIFSFFFFYGRASSALFKNTNEIIIHVQQPISILPYLFTLQSYNRVENTLTRLLCLFLLHVRDMAATKFRGD